MFFHETESILRELRRADLNPSKRKQLLHTLKGNAGIPGLWRIAEICHRAETELEDDEEVSVETMGLLLDLWAKVAQALRAVTGGAVIELSDTRPRRSCDSRAARRASARVARRARTSALGAGRAPPRSPGGSWPRAGSPAQGAEIDVRVQGDDLRLDPERWNPLWSTLVHLIRNAVDHGLETIDERVSAGKPIRAMLRLEARRRDRGCAWRSKTTGAASTGRRSASCAGNAGCRARRAPSCSRRCCGPTSRAASR